VILVRIIIILLLSLLIIIIMVLLLLLLINLGSSGMVLAYDAWANRGGDEIEIVLVLN
jgi:hypothetical protein